MLSIMPRRTATSSWLVSDDCATDRRDAGQRMIKKWSILRGFYLQTSASLSEMPAQSGGAFKLTF
jgi:hypothetical protein